MMSPRVDVTWRCEMCCLVRGRCPSGSGEKLGMRNLERTGSLWGCSYFFQAQFTFGSRSPEAMIGVPCTYSG